MGKYRVHAITTTPTRSNKVMIIQLDDDKGVFKETAVFDHPYPTTKVILIYVLFHACTDVSEMVRITVPACIIVHARAGVESTTREERKMCILRRNMYKSKGPQ